MNGHNQPADYFATLQKSGKERERESIAYGTLDTNTSGGSVATVLSGKSSHPFTSALKKDDSLCSQYGIDRDLGKLSGESSSPSGLGHFLRSFWSYTGGSWDHFGAILWEGGILLELYWGKLGSFWNYSLGRWDSFGAILGEAGIILELFFGKVGFFWSYTGGS